VDGVDQPTIARMTHAANGISPHPVRPQRARDRRASCNLTWLIAGAVQAFLADHVEQRRRLVRVGQQLARRGARIGPLLADA
jgi:hypothetical protein